MAIPVSFTVAIPTHNRRETVVLAALSAIRQTRPPLDVLVLCDGCSDGTAEAIAELGDDRIRAIQLDKGPGYAYAHRDVAAEVGRGDVLTYLADDDLFLPDHFERIGKRWDEDDVDIVVAPAVIVHEDDRLEWIGRDWSIDRHREVMLTETNTSVMASVSVRRELVTDVGGWNGELPRAADWDLWQRILQQGARPAMTDAVSVLHFRATTRRQAWSLRVRQNTRWAQLLTDEAAVEALRPSFARARSQFEAELSAHLGRALTAHAAAEQAARERDATLTEAHARLVDAERRAADGAEHARHASVLAAQLDAAHAHARALEAELAEARRERASVEPLLARADRDHATLQQIYAGGWWRLRGRVRRLLRRAP